VILIANKKSRKKLGSETEKGDADTDFESHGQNGDDRSLFPFLKKGNSVEAMRGIIMCKCKEERSGGNIDSDPLEMYV
jgi:hypothetical protein